MTRAGGGFTLIELMVTLAIAAIVLTVGIPSFRDLIRNNRLTTAANELVGALNLARSEAIKRGARVTVCKSADGASCTTSGNWAQGWIVFTDENSDGAYDTTDDTLLRIRQPISEKITMIGNTNVANYISYVATGRSKLINGSLQAGTIKICDDHPSNIGKNIVLSFTGRIRVETGVSCP